MPRVEFAVAAALVVLVSLSAMAAEKREPPDEFKVRISPVPTAGSIATAR